MRAMALDAAARSVRLESRPVPAPGEGEVLIRVAAAGVNRPDVLQRRGFYPPPPGAPSIPGLEVAGIVAAVGAEVPEALVGQPVTALVAGGGYAEFCVAPVGQCLPVPAALTMAEAAARLERVLTNDPGTGVMRHADAGYEIAKDCAREQGLRLPMVE